MAELDDRVRVFCKVCDFYQEGSRCFVAKESQDFYVGRGFCAWGRVSGISASTVIKNESVTIREV